MKFIIDTLKFNEAGLIPAIVQEAAGKEVLMLAWMNREAVEKTLVTGEVWFYSRSRQRLWKKGETSGHVQKLKGFYYDCDADTLLLLVEQAGGAACHEGYSSCFHNKVKPDGMVVVEGDKLFDPALVYGNRPPQAPAGSSVLDELYRLILSRKAERPADSYTTYLFEKGIDKICKKVGEECAEVIIGAKNSRAELTYETADLLYHLLVLLAHQGVEPAAVYQELAGRKK
ncbi:bifunctional phosphoribosyl-AMP cyclohydrolase/phosphoribosyl-ATP diphosphatase HisIE [Desulforamulus hydrothermalis]|uniref:Histidine biosynthesis bifunctional protein HisIE n=1 Tax=Desulforamulus hydrothermalis Lam5 = DSM 18033 TaxID=1121428 RepID=K8E0T6_9FIRM|nr:bifunctional phosphoribosyl-AMP cyclohydrolase/phosphoribosyl-ATP diphosphatase HisIE [Desulforamulus hydrothermalis]CCO09242.1 Histidine biosynthesis bifunctional protein HisIE (Includes: Phosphoribosyl-AMP cyclohydrolase; Phosphoribosyl-ATP pyrophosphatase) [Desulforamulus hydrothermalis Lam5 = DSM 18033]SHH05764.1 phosphoribosyl-ATP pyrophosphatase /phosphoribosyl-AMP cyclohydrolase [Desulforamulus hydrothermalis Lam5 = DSM 18033]